MRGYASVRHLPDNLDAAPSTYHYPLALIATRVAAHPLPVNTLNGSHDVAMQ